VGREKPKKHWFRRIVVTLGLAGAAAWVASRAAGGSVPEPVRIPTTPTPPPTSAPQAPATPAPKLSEGDSAAEAAQAADGSADAEDSVAAQSSSDDDSASPRQRPRKA